MSTEIRSSGSNASSGDDEQHSPIDVYATKVREWAEKIPIGMGLCPWAGKSNNKGLLRVVTCICDAPNNAAEMIEREVELLSREGTPPLSTTLIVCPHVPMWKEFQSFDEFVRNGFKRQLSTSEVLDNVTLVAFHPEFSRWHGLPEDVGVGSEVNSHWGMIGQKSRQTATATIIETNNKAFGLRKIKVRFHSTMDGRQEQYVPIDWLDLSETGPPLPDNFMYRAPYPTIHIIANQDLASMRICDVSKVKRLNASRMAKLGWEGLDAGYTG